MTRLLRDYGIVVHGGAGSFVPADDVPMRRKVLAKSAETGFRLLHGKGGSSTDAVEEAIKVMEDSKVFNAGSGSSLDIEGKVSADASIINGDLSCGAIGNVRLAKNPISLARKVMQHSDHVFLVGDAGVSKFMDAIRMKKEPLEPAKHRLAQYERNLQTMKRGKVKAWPRNYRLLPAYLKEVDSNLPENRDTVGAVAIDESSNVSAGVSTGGRWLKLPGRVGDSAIIGAGIYADTRAGAASATGAGEDIIRVCLCKTTCDLMKNGADAQSACDAAVSILTEVRGIGTAGVIAVDKHGRFGASRNTEMLQRAFRFRSMRRAHVAILPHEKDPPQRAPDLGDPRLRF
jgi:beta-aspartyl-peptidase (threonine type)